jgi:hypothetical protein
MMFRIIRSLGSIHLQLLQDLKEINGDNLNNIRPEANRHFKNKNRDCLKDKINELATNGKNRNVKKECRAIKLSKMNLPTYKKLSEGFE